MEGQVLAALDGDRLRLEMNEARANLDMARREHERMISLHERGLVSAAAFEGMQFNVDALQAVYELKRLNVGYTKIRAPISGVVSSRDIKLGQHLSVNDATFRVTDVSLLVAHLKIPQSELARIAVGNQAEIRVDAMSDQVFTATIDRISPTIDMKNGTFRATAYVDNDGGLLAPGMFGRFDIAYERHEDALTIPSDAVIAEDNVSVVYIVEDGETGHLVPVNDHEALARRLLQVMRQPAATEQMILRAREKSAQFTWPVVEAQWRSMYADLFETANNLPNT